MIWKKAQASIFFKEAYFAKTWRRTSGTLRLPYIMEKGMSGGAMSQCLR